MVNFTATETEEEITVPQENPQSIVSPKIEAEDSQENEAAPLNSNEDKDNSLSLKKDLNVDIKVLLEDIENTKENELDQPVDEDKLKIQAATKEVSTLDTPKQETSDEVNVDNVEIADDKKEVDRPEFETAPNVSDESHDDHTKVYSTYFVFLLS